MIGTDLHDRRLTCGKVMSEDQITAEDLYNYVKCPHRVYLDSNGDRKEKSEVNLFVRLLWEKGLQTEKDYLTTLGECEITDLSERRVKDAWPETDHYMKKGTELIYQACLEHGPYLGRPDLLLKRTEVSSYLGPYYYEPIDIKAGRGWEIREEKYRRFKKHYAFQVLFYRMLLASIQHYLPPVARIINVEGEIEEFDPLDFQDEFTLVLNQVERLVQGKESSEPVLGSHCAQCEWFGHCRRWVKKTSDPTGIFFVGKSKFRLKEVGLNTIEDLAKMDISQYLKPPLKMPGLGEKSLRRMKERAKVHLQGSQLSAEAIHFRKTDSRYTLILKMIRPGDWCISLDF